MAVLVGPVVVSPSVASMDDAAAQRGLAPSALRQVALCGRQSDGFGGSHGGVVQAPEEGFEVGAAVALRADAFK